MFIPGSNITFLRFISISDLFTDTLILLSPVKCLKCQCVMSCCLSSSFLVVLELSSLSVDNHWVLWYLQAVHTWFFGQL
jgi:hypothetical protein